MRLRTQGSPLKHLPSATSERGLRGACWQQRVSKAPPGLPLSGCCSSSSRGCRGAQALRSPPNHAHAPSSSATWSLAQGGTPILWPLKARSLYQQAGRGIPCNSKGRESPQQASWHASGVEGAAPNRHASSEGTGSPHVSAPTPPSTQLCSGQASVLPRI